MRHIIPLLYIHQIVVKFQDINFFMLLLHSCIFKGFRAGTQLSSPDDSLQFLIHINTLTARLKA